MAPPSHANRRLHVTRAPQHVNAVALQHRTVSLLAFRNSLAINGPVEGLGSPYNRQSWSSEPEPPKLPPAYPRSPVAAGSGLTSSIPAFTYPKLCMRLCAKRPFTSAAKSTTSSCRGSMPRFGSAAIHLWRLSRPVESGKPCSIVAPKPSRLNFWKLRSHWVHWACLNLRRGPERQDCSAHVSPSPISGGGFGGPSTWGRSRFSPLLSVAEEGSNRCEPISKLETV